MIKNKLKNLLQSIMGFENYLYYFSRFKIFMLRHNRYEQGFMQFMDLIPEGDTILDIGANIGITAIPLAKRFPKLTVHAFEPMPGNVKALEHIINTYRLKNINLHQIALGETEGELKMVMPVINHVKMQGLSHVYAEGNYTAWNKGELFTVPVKKLDDVADLKQVGKIAAIKIDVENFEHHVLKGAYQLLTRHKPLIYCELWDNEVRPLVITYLSGIGYAVKVLENNKLVNFTSQLENNFIFMPVP